MEWKWDNWQKRVLDHEGNVTIRAGRQSGKSEVISEKAVRFALENAGTTTLVIAAAQRQSGLIFEKIRGRIEERIRLGEDLFPLDKKLKPTMTRIVLSNGSRIYCVPAGRTGYSIRGFTIDLLIADEAAYIPEQVWLAVTPMLAVSKKTRGFGWLITISTPFGKGGFFYNNHHDKGFLAVHVSSEDCPRIDKGFLAKERKRMSKLQYAQEYLAEFIDDYRQYFPTVLIKKCMSFIEWSLSTDYRKGASYYLGLDVARYGGDENAFVIGEYYKKKLKIVKVFTTSRVSITDTVGRVLDTHRHFGFKKIFVDDSGVGGGVTDMLQDKIGKHRVVGLNNASKRVSMQGEDRSRGILKEDLYSNALVLMETGQVELINDLDLLRSMKSITFEYTDSGRVKIFGSYSHLAEAFIRACWCVKERGLSLFAILK